MLFGSFCEAIRLGQAGNSCALPRPQNIHDWQGFMKEKIEKRYDWQSHIQVIMQWIHGPYSNLNSFTYIC